MFKNQLNALLKEYCIIQKLNFTSLRGYSLEEIDHFESLYGFSFPQLYRDFLELIGKDMSKLIKGCLFDSLSLYNVYQNFFKYEKDETCVLPPEKNVVFCTSDGHGNYEYFVNSGNDPDMFYYAWCYGDMPLSMKFSERILSVLQNRIHYAKTGTVLFNEIPDLYS